MLIPGKTDVSQASQQKIHILIKAVLYIIYIYKYFNLLNFILLISILQILKPADKKLFYGGGGGMGSGRPVTPPRKAKKWHQ